MTKPTERLVEVALIDGDGVTHHGFREHWELRASLGRPDPYQKDMSDTYGFWTSEGRFVSRSEGMRIGAAAGQCQIMGRGLLSSDVTWMPRTLRMKVQNIRPESREQRRNRERRERKAQVQA
jgi:hypothetical protein